MTKLRLSKKFLTGRQAHIVSLYAKGWSQTKIASHLGITRSAVDQRVGKSTYWIGNSEYPFYRTQVCCRYAQYRREQFDLISEYISTFATLETESDPPGQIPAACSELLPDYSKIETGNESAKNN